MANPAKVKSRVRSVSAYGQGVYHVVFDVPRHYTRFRPGQFLHLTLDEFDPTVGYWPESRVFSIGSAPSQDHVVVVYSVKGRYTQRMQQELVPGREVWLKLPYGDFVIDDTALGSGPVVLMAGGTGVSPYLPFLLKAEVPAVPVHLYYGVRSPEHLLFADELKALTAQPWFHLHLLVEEGGVEGLVSRTGRLSVSDTVAELGSNSSTAHFYLSGPPGMIRQFKTDLGGFGVAAEQIHIDSWE